MSKSSILDGNSFDPTSSSGLPAADQRLVEKRVQLLGPAYRLFYRTPIHPVRGRGAYLYDADGVEYLDGYNNVPGVGHANPRVAQAVYEQMSELNVHTRYLNDRIITYAERLLATAPDEINQVMFTNSGSESNDLAIRVARAYTGGTAIVVTAEAYHGTSKITAGASPAMGSGYELDPEVYVLPTPDSYRLGATSPQELGEWFAQKYRDLLQRIHDDGLAPAAFLADSIFSSDGVFPGDPGFLQPIVDAVHDSGALFISDEVQPGLARTGESFWGFGRHGVVPDLVTTGKALGNGIPVSAMLVKSTVLEPFASTTPYFNTFGGNRVSIAAAEAVLSEIEDHDLQQNAMQRGGELIAGIAEIAKTNPVIGDVRGSGLYLGVEIISDASEKTPDSSLTLQIVNGMRDRRVLISSAGPLNNVLKIRPPLVFGQPEVSRFLAEFEDTLLAVS